MAAHHRGGKLVSGSFADRPAIARADPFPIQVGHDLIDIGRSLRAKIEMIGMLVHVEREDRRTARQPVRMVCGPLVDQPPKRSDQARIAQPEPPPCALAIAVNSARQAVNAAEIALQRVCKFVRWLGKPVGRVVAVSAKQSK